MSYQAGVHNTVAVSGTAFTDEHINLIKRFCDTVVLSFDSDSAGQAASKKTALLCLLGGLDVYAIDDIGTKDPADLIKEDSAKWKESIEKKRHIIQVMLRAVLDSTEDARAQGQRIVTDVLPFVRAVQSPVDRSHFIKVISDESGIPMQTLMEELSRGAVAPPIEDAPKTALSISLKERLSRELIAYARLHDKKSDPKFIGTWH
jgi:DNA primase